MPEAPLKFIPDQKSGWHELAGASPLAVNVVIDGQGAVYRRPGITQYEQIPDEEGDTDFDDGIVGLWVSLDDNLYVIGNEAPVREVYRMRFDGTQEYLSREPPDSGGYAQYAKSLLGTNRPTFAETEAMVVIAGGDLPQKITKVSRFSSRLGGSPPKSTHVAALYSRVVMNDLTNSDNATEFAYSDAGLGSTVPATHETWPGANYTKAEARPDKIVALGEATNELFVFGQTTTEIYSSDPVFVFGRVQAREVGCAAPYSVIKADQTFYWLDNQRRFVASDGRSFDILSTPLQETLDNIGTVTDCFGYRVRTGPFDCLVWTFPTDGRSFCYQIGGGWALWMGWDDAQDQHVRLNVNAHATRYTTGDNIVATNGTRARIGVMKRSALTDFGDRIVAEVVTGYENRGTDRLKHCLGVRISLRRGTVTGSTEPIGFLYFRDEPGDWGQPLEVSFGASGDREITVRLRSLGVYRRRQWRFVFSDTSDFVLAGASEEFEVLDN